MALTVNAEALTQLPSSLEGLYLFPYEWFKYGINNGHLEIEDLSFYDTIQGSMFLALERAKAPMTLRDEEYDGTVPVWYAYQSGSGKVVSTVDPEVNRNEHRFSCIFDEYLKAPVFYCSMERLCHSSKSNQKTINNSIIQLFKGCNVKLKHSVWF